MPRIARVAPKEYIYHILTRGNNRQNVFRCERDFKEYLEILQKYKRRYKFKLYHYVLMKNHVHLVLEPTEQGGSLAEIMKGINISYAKYYKNRYEHIGHFWQDRYKSIIISEDNYLLACGSYVELNPVRANIVEDPRDYKWSSYRRYAYGENDKIVDEHPIYKELLKSETSFQEKYRKFIREMLLKNMMKGEMEKRVIYGNKKFTSEIMEEFRVKKSLNPIGRPKKNDKN